jgi:hypothetical protein
VLAPATRGASWPEQSGVLVAPAKPTSSALRGALISLVMIAIAGAIAFVVDLVDSPATPTAAAATAPEPSTAPPPAMAAARPAPSPTHVAPVTPPPPPPEPAPPTEISIKITTTPADATVLFDGNRLGHTPFEGKIPVTPGPHALKIRRRGYATMKLDVDLTKNVEQTVTLQPAPPGA